jgi:hypothetical protein
MAAFVSAVEPAASYWAVHEAPAADVPEGRLKAIHPELANLLASKGEEHLRQVAVMLARIYGSTGNFRRFLLTFAPDPPPSRPPHPYQQVDWSKLGKHLDLVYSYRSKDLHAGIPIPQPMCKPPDRGEGMPPIEVPLGLWASVGPEHAAWARPDLPMLLHVFEGIVRRALLAWCIHQPAA